jgi:chromosomal replication initiator protein
MEGQLRLEIDETAALRALWEEVLAAAEPTLGREAIQSWLRDARPVSLANGILTLAAPHATARDWIEKKYLRSLGDLLEETRGEPVSVELVVERGPAKVSRRKEAERSPAPEASPATRPAPPRPPVPAIFAPIPLNEKYTFESFVVGQSNRFAHAAAAAIAAHPGKEYNPLFIYGGVGLGKTHLLHAVGHALQQRNPRTRIAYVSAETFTSHFVTSLREKREEEFRRAYRSVDVWLVDDIQFIADKTSTKEEFFHTFNELYLTNRQIVLASDRPPRELRLMEDRLRTRLEAGLLVEIAAPELETRMAILQQRAEMEGAPLPPEVAYHIARTVTDNVRVLEAALIRLLALSSLTHSPLTPELAARAVGAFVRDAHIVSTSLAAIQKIVCEQFSIEEKELVGLRRDRPTALARQVAMYLMRELTKKSLSEIGQHFGGKAHSTVLYSCAKLEKEMDADSRLQSTVQSLRARLAGEG